MGEAEDGRIVRTGVIPNERVLIDERASKMVVELDTVRHSNNGTSEPAGVQMVESAIEHETHFSVLDQSGWISVTVLDLQVGFHPGSLHSGDIGPDLRWLPGDVGSKTPTFQSLFLWMSRVARAEAGQPFACLS